MSGQFHGVPGPSQDDFNNLSDQIEPQEISTGVTDLKAYKTGNVVELVYNSSTGTAVSAGGFAYINANNALPTSLRPKEVVNYGIASNASRQVGFAGVSTSGLVFVAAPAAMTLTLFSVTYVV